MILKHTENGSDQPLVRGGQGRSEDDLTTAARTLSSMIILVVVFAVTVVVGLVAYILVKGLLSL